MWEGEKLSPIEVRKEVKLDERTEESRNSVRF